MSEIRGASKINDQEFLEAYNNEQLDNAGVIAALSTDWTAVGVKLRSGRVTLHTTVERTGGKGGTFTKRGEPLALEAQIWIKHNIVQPQPNGPYVTLADRLRDGKIAIDGDLNVTEVTATPATTTATTKEDALHALFTKLQELNFSKVSITNRRTGSAVGINDIQNGGEYKLAKQLTAANDDAPAQDEIDDVLNQCMEAENAGSSRWPGMSYEQGVAAALRWMINGGQHPMED